MKFNSKDLFDAFYQLYGGKYPHLSKEQMKEAIYTPWQVLHETIANGSLDSFRMKYIGMFRVYKGNAKKGLAKAKDYYEKGIITEEKYLEVKRNVENFLKDES